MCCAKVALAGNALTDLGQAIGLRFLLERHNLPARDRSERCPSPKPHARRHRLCRDRDVRLAIDMRVDQLVVIHPVEMIAGEDQVVVGIVACEMAHGLPHGVGRALEPVRVVGRLFGREDFDESLAEMIHPIGLRDVPVERLRIELRQDENPADVGVQAVADGDVNQTIVPADRHRRLRPILREGKQAGSLTTTQDQR